jgi:hypothetical protein
MIDRVVVTVFPGYLFMSVLCLRSIHKYFADTPITIIIDDYGLDCWPNFVEQYQTYISSQFVELDITYRKYSELDGVDEANMGGWFRQQLIKLHVDQFVSEDRILLVDADVILEELPNLNAVPANSWPYTPISAGFHHYIEFMLGIAPWLGTKEENLCASWVPIRFVTRDLIQSLRQHVEQQHNQNFLRLHIDLMKQQQIVAFDPNCETMIMSEFEMLEVFRKYLWTDPLPLQPGIGKFYHTSDKDWNQTRTWFEKQQVQVSDELWDQVQRFGSNPTIH